MPLNGIIWIIIQHSRNWSTFTLDGFLTVMNFIYKKLFNHQPFDGLSIIINTIKLFTNRFGSHGSNENKDIKYKKLNITGDE